MNDKSYFRNIVLNKRNAMDIDEIEQKSEVIINKYISTEYYRDSKTIFCYIDFKNEVVTRKLLKRCLNDKKILAVPMIVKCKNSKEMLSARINDIEGDLEEGYFGIMEPSKDKAKIIDPESIDTIIVPGLAFDLKGSRIGFGAGFYDRFFKQTRIDCIKLGVCYEFQLFDEIASEAHDIGMDMIITENSIIQPRT